MIAVGDAMDSILDWLRRLPEPAGVPRQPVALEGDVMKIDWLKVAEVQFARHGCLFQVILMDPSWRIHLELDYPVLSDTAIFSIPLHLLQTDGYLLVWIVNQKEERVKALLKKQGYQYIDKITWLNRTSRGNFVNGWGVTVRHSTETCFIFRKGAVRSFSKLHTASDAIDAAIQDASMKPD